MSRWLDVSLELTRLWLSVYTTGLPAETKRARRAELDSDLWEHVRAGSADRVPPAATAAQVLARLVLGIPADIAWRIETGASLQREGRAEMSQTLFGRTVFLAALAAAAFPVLTGMAVMAGSGSGWDSEAERLLFGAMWALMGAAMVAGLVVSRRSPRLGTALVASGAIAISVSWYWAAVALLPVGAVMVAIAYMRGRDAGSPRGTGTA